jgi:FKBP-type peptidyl-prolyl cis-trans isomerase
MRLALAFAATAALCAADGPAPSASAADLRATISMLAGMEMAQAVKQYDLDPAVVAATIQGSAPAPAAEVLARREELLLQWQDHLAGRQRAAAELRTAGNADWLKTNAAKPGVTTTATGLQYEVLAAGTGPSPKATDTVHVRYRGTLLDGTQFDATAAEPAVFSVNGLIAGWQEALQLMKVGDRWKISLPPQLAYGDSGAPPAIGPNEILQFEMELVAIAP